MSAVEPSCLNYLSILFKNCSTQVFQYSSQYKMVSEDARNASEDSCLLESGIARKAYEGDDLLASR